MIIIQTQYKDHLVQGLSLVITSRVSNVKIVKVRSQYSSPL